MSERYERALAYATTKHKHQYRIGGDPYITHPIAVAEFLKERGYNEDYQIAGLFHDLLEDTDALESEILELSNQEILDAVKLLTKEKDYVMAEYIANIKANPIAKAVKTYDRLHNLRCAKVADIKFKKKYILESTDWFLDFSEEIPKAVMELSKTFDLPIKSFYQDKPIETDFKTSAFVLKGDICYSTSLNELKTIKDGYLVSIDGKVIGTFDTLPNEYENLKYYDYTNKLIIPGLVDLHIHAPQYAFRGMGMDLELMDWLNNQTFPEEVKYQDLEYAKKAYTIFAEAMKKSATTHACVFATKHRNSTELLMDIMEDTGLVSYIGKVNMDKDAPALLCEPSAEYAGFDTFGWVNKTINKYRNTKPILTPRFIPTCSSELLEQLQEIQAAYNLPVQSHLSENLGEIDYVKKMYPNIKSYADAYDQFGLFGVNKENNKYHTIMAHCVYSKDEEVEMLKKNEVFVAHCPSSNNNLSSGIAPIRTFLDNNILVGLGSDVAGGHSESILRTICDTVQVSKLYWRLIDKTKNALSFKEAFYLGTKGGGKFFGKVGSFESGYDFSCVVLDDSLIKHPFELTIEQRLERASYSALDLYGICAKFILKDKII